MDTNENNRVHHLWFPVPGIRKVQDLLKSKLNTDEKKFIVCYPGQTSCQSQAPADEHYRCIRITCGINEA
jgi:hypothetical protein